VRQKQPEMPAQRRARRRGPFKEPPRRFWSDVSNDRWNFERFGFLKPLKAITIMPRLSVVFEILDVFVLSVEISLGS
jgi:hypothetical protein